MEKEDFKEVLLQVLELQLDYQLRAIRQLQGKPEPEPVLARPRGRRRQSLVDLSVKILTEEGKPLHVNELSRLLQVRFGRRCGRSRLVSRRHRGCRASGAVDSARGRGRKRHRPTGPAGVPSPVPYIG